MLHYPKSKACQACCKAKVIRRQMRRAKYSRFESQPAVRFGDHVSCDHIIVRNVKRPQAHERRNGERVALLVRDEFTLWTKAYPAKTKSTGEVIDALVDFAGGKKIRRLYSDGAKEYKRAARKLRIAHQVSTPERPQTNAWIERTIQLVVNGA